MRQIKYFYYSNARSNNRVNGSIGSISGVDIKRMNVVIDKCSIIIMFITQIINNTHFVQINS